MILAEKIMKLRKQKGWSQEELALRLNVSRQSVSKWESMTSVPDLDKIIKISELFGVSTDYLLKDDMEEEPGYEPSETFVEEEDDFKKKRPFSLEEANTYLTEVENGGKKIAMGVAACVACAVPMLVLAGVPQVSERVASALGVAILLIIVACAVITFIMQGMKLDKYEYIGIDPLDLEYGVDGIIRARKSEFEPTFKRCIATGVALCIVSVVPVCLAAALDAPEMWQVLTVAVLLLLVAIGVYQFVWAGTIYGSFQKILEEGDYTYRKKVENKQNDNLSKVYWCIATALYLAISFTTGKWHITWVLWPVAGVAFAAVCGIANMVRKH